MRPKRKKGRQFGRNERKLKTLEIFERAFLEALRPETYAWRIGRYLARAAYSYLKRLERWSLLVRLGKPIRYRVADKGQRRLAWLRSGLRARGVIRFLRCGLNTPSFRGSTVTDF